jgi:hypothetical protein
MPKPAAADKLKQFFLEVGDLSDLSLRAVLGIFSKPFYYREFTIQMDKIGVGSLFIVLLTGLFTGMVMALQALLRQKKALFILFVKPSDDLKRRLFFHQLRDQAGIQQEFHNSTSRLSS